MLAPVRIGAAAAVAATLTSGNVAHAARLSMICENPRQEYLVTFDEVVGTFFADETQYRVLAVEKNVERYVIVGLTVDNGPTFRAHFRPYRKMEFYAENQLFQTDGCH